MRDLIDDYNDYVVWERVVLVGILVLTPCVAAAVALQEVHFTLAALGVCVFATALVVAGVAIGNTAQRRRMKNYQHYLRKQHLDTLTLAAESSTMSRAARHMMRDVLNQSPSTKS